MEQEYTFTLTSGRRVWVDEFHFERTYAGLMAGYPENEPGYVTKQEKKAETMWGAGATFIVPPVTIIRKHGERKYASWPHYCYKASLTSANIDPGDDGSRLIVIWFGEEPVGTSFLAMIENACRDVPWEKYAKGWNF
jgi:hypothetical protein